MSNNYSLYMFIPLALAFLVLISYIFYSFLNNDFSEISANVYLALLDAEKNTYGGVQRGYVKGMVAKGGGKITRRTANKMFRVMEKEQHNRALAAAKAQIQ